MPVFLFPKISGMGDFYVFRRLHGPMGLRKT